MVCPRLFFTSFVILALASLDGRAGQDKEPVYNGKKAQSG